MPSIYHTPTGPVNLATLFPDLNFTDIDQYFVEVLDSGNNVLATTPIFNLSGCNDDVNLSFVNYLGNVDSMSFSVTVEHDTKATTFQRPTTNPLQRSVHGITRNSIRSTKNFTGVASMDESQMPLLAELLDSPLAWMQDAGGYIPVIITDQSIVEKKDTERYSYDVTLKFSLSHERIVISN